MLNAHDSAIFVNYPAILTDLNSTFTASSYMVVQSTEFALTAIYTVTSTKQAIASLAMDQCCFFAEGANLVRSWSGGFRLGTREMVIGPWSRVHLAALLPHALANSLVMSTVMAEWFKIGVAAAQLTLLL